MGPRWALVFCLFVLGIARSTQGDSRFPFTKDPEYKKMMRYGDVKIPEWNKARLNSVAMSDGSQQPFMTEGALARDGMPLMDSERPTTLRKGPKGGSGGKGGGGKGGSGKGGGGKGKYYKGHYDKGKHDKGHYDKGKHDKGHYDKGHYDKGKSHKG